jgi:hypothetical protein
MPPNTVYVGRGTRYGNPYTVKEHGRKLALDYYERWLMFQVVLHQGFLEPLRGKDLACWCKPDESCHADILLRLANI